MNQIENDISRRRKLGTSAASMLRRSMLGGIAAILMGVGLAYPSGVSAHNIGVQSAKLKVREYVRSVINAPGSRYVRATTTCNKAFNGHNHYVRCMVQYKDRESENKGRVYACTEHIEVYFQSHNLLRGESNIYYMKHTSPECGHTRYIN